MAESRPLVCELVGFDGEEETEESGPSPPPLPPLPPLPPSVRVASPSLKKRRSDVEESRKISIDLRCETCQISCRHGMFVDTSTRPEVFFCKNHSKEEDAPFAFVESFMIARKESHSYCRECCLHFPRESSHSCDHEVIRCNECFSDIERLNNSAHLSVCGKMSKTECRVRKLCSLCSEVSSHEIRKNCVLGFLETSKITISILTKLLRVRDDWSTEILAMFNDNLEENLAESYDYFMSSLSKYTGNVKNRNCKFLLIERSGRRVFTLHMGQIATSIEVVVTKEGRNVTVSCTQENEMIHLSGIKLHVESLDKSVCSVISIRKKIHHFSLVVGSELLMLKVFLTC